MPRVRRRFRLEIDGETFEVETNALDLVKAERDGQGSVQQGLRTAHIAALRQRKPVPVKFETFAEQLDAFDDITDEPDDDGEVDDDSDLDPIQSEDWERSP